METLDKHFRALTGPSFAKRGRVIGDIITHWPEIVGQSLADCGMPERIRWPKSADAAQHGGVLVMRAAPGRALDFTHETQIIIERINAFLGYRAVASLKVMQGHKSFGASRPSGPMALEPAAAADLERKLADIADDRLRDALKRLGAGALSKGPDSPQPK